MTNFNPNTLISKSAKTVNVDDISRSQEKDFFRSVASIYAYTPVRTYSWNLEKYILYFLKALSSLNRGILTHFSHYIGVFV